MTFHVDLVVDVVRLEERLIREALSRWARVRLVDLDRDPVPIGGASADAAVIRPISMYRAAYAAGSYEASRVFTVNSSEAIIYSGDKMLTYTRMRAHRVPVPKAYYAATPEAAGKAASELGYPVVVKAPVGSWGRLVSRARSPEKLEQIARLRQALPCSQQHAMIVQEYLELGGADIRCVVVYDRVLGCIVRRARRGEWRSNVALGASVEPLEHDEELEELALRAARALGGFFVSVDIFETKTRGYVVNEVNGVPEFKGFMRATGVNPAEELSSALHWRLRH